MHEIHIVAAHDARRMICKIDLPGWQQRIRFREQTFLDLSRELKIILNDVELFLRQIAETQPDQRIGDKSLRLDRVVTFLANTICSLIEASQRGVDLAKKSRHIRIKRRL